MRGALISPSWGRPRLDLGSCVLYLPLWRPSKDMEGSTIYSYDKYRHSGAVTGAIWNNLGIHGRYFDGSDDRIVVPNHSAFSFGTGDFSIELWLKASSTGANIQRLVSKQAAAWLFFRLVTGVPTLSIKDGTNEQTVACSSDLRDDSWHYLCVTVDRDDSSGFTIFVDGASCATDDPTGVGSITNATDLQIARFSGGLEYFKGNIGEIKIYSRCLKLTEVARSYQATKWRYET